MTLLSAYAPGQFCWVDLMAHDLGAAEKFYGELFGWSAVHQDTQGGPPYVQFAHEGHAVAGMGQMPYATKAQGIPPVWNSYINVADVEATARKIEETGGRITMPVMEVLDAGRMAFVQDSEGASFALWQANRHKGAAYVNHAGGWCWNELATRDLKVAKRFYHEVFGWKYEENPESPSAYFMIKNGERMNGGMIQMTEEWGDMPPCWGVYFSVDDCAGSAEKAKALGGANPVPPFDAPPVGQIAVLADPQGAHFYIIEMSVEPD